MTELTAQKVLEIAEELVDVNLHVFFQEPKTQLKEFTPFDNQVLKKLLSDNPSPIREYVFKPRHRGFIVRLTGEGKIIVSSYANSKESREITMKIVNILNRPVVKQEV